ncbi:MAG: hypothetical protein WD696_09150 [Bryobacteraceae bacterium]
MNGDVESRRAALARLNPADDALIPIGMEVDAAGKVTKNSFGVFNLSWQAQCHPEWPRRIAEEAHAIRAAIQETHGVPLRFLIWAGMGGSIEDKSMYQALGLLKGGPKFYSLDSTDPAKLKSILEDMTRRSGLPLPAVLRSTLVVGMAMGMTSYEPVLNLEKLTALYNRYRIDARPNFLYMTLPGSILDKFAAPRGYRKVDLQLDGDNSTAGRHSGPLTRGSLYPLALAGADLRKWMAATFLSDEEIFTAWKLAAFIHAQGLSGRDKLTLFLPKAMAGAALWTKQDFEESLGKCENLGLKVVIGEKAKLSHYRPARDPRQDRAFLVVQYAGSPNNPATARLRRAGYPVATLKLNAAEPLSRYMQFIHYAVFGVGYLRQMNFVTQPSVELYKAITGRVAGKTGQAWRKLDASAGKATWRNAITLHYEGFRNVLKGRPELRGDAPGIYAAILKRLGEDRNIEYGELTFFGDSRYSLQGRAVRAKLEAAGNHVFRGRLKMPVDVYEGPAMNHSYHEMIIGHGKCFSTVLISEKLEKIPAAGYEGDYHRAQFLATRMALAERGRPVVALVLKNLNDRTLEALDEFFLHAASSLQ